MPKHSQYLPRRQEIVKVCREARENCGIHWLAQATTKLDIPPRTLQRLCHEWRIFYTNRQFFRKNKQTILKVLGESRTLDTAAAELTARLGRRIARSTLFDLRLRWEGARTRRHRVPRRVVGTDGRVRWVNAMTRYKR